MVECRLQGHAGSLWMTSYVILVNFLNSLRLHFFYNVSAALRPLPPWNAITPIVFRFSNSVTTVLIVRPALKWTIQPVSFRFKRKQR